ncbi:hypothetical protein RC74_20230 [Falsihalocynthiibacter arcticus]|uniref:Uncharacterized protein n=1 Tax=Falsihalocynthiibacter arcticus TaxID=1579316 RepID=A0A126V4L3_9RHOB|nr:hypothetical protein RC74_20230 [Falsihalocynthiibacter arcticus]
MTAERPWETMGAFLIHGSDRGRIAEFYEVFTVGLRRVEGFRAIFGKILGIHGLFLHFSYLHYMWCFYFKYYTMGANN